ncbi:hypothetical protein NS234_12260 [Microbacterium oxydans]|uniref:hypothetical protein n=1 Tax=Microbacterium oxydans TaxID=82380 RepID=UPI0007342D90|nr:hypothetical protein [Microbacterium oxydans]KTR76193.1 hypothetical protein NS234_12260 [Microbacterium oxydans]
MLRDLSDAWGWLQRIIRRIDRLESGAPLENASITNGRLRIIGGTLRVDSGGSVQIVGTLSIDGTTTVTGSFKVTGPWRLEGDGTITGNVVGTGTLTWNGPWNLNGAGKIAGNTELTGDLNVTGGGKVKAGNVSIDPSSNGGSVKFAGGPEVYGSGSELSLYSGGGGSFVTLSPTMAKINGPGARWFEITGSGVRIVNLPTKTSASAGGLPAGVVHADASGNLFRIVP